MEVPQRYTELLIMAVKDHECLWRDKQGSTRAAKERAWEKIAKKFYPGQWQMCGQETQEEIISRIKKQWSTLKYSYNDYKRKLDSNECVKKRKPNHFDALSFMDANFENVCDKTLPDASQDNLTPDLTPMKQKTPTVMNVNCAEGKEISSKEHENSNRDKNLKANEHFLLSLLPDLEKMNKGQATDFKIGTMTLIRDIMSREKPAPRKITKRTSKGSSSSNNKGKPLIRKKGETVESTSKTGEITSTKEGEIVCIDDDITAANPASKHAKPAPTMTSDSYQIKQELDSPEHSFPVVRNTISPPPASRPLTIWEKLNSL